MWKFFLSKQICWLRWGNIEFPLPFGRVMNPTESFIHTLDEKVSAIHFAYVNLEFDFAVQNFYVAELFFSLTL